MEVLNGLLVTGKGSFAGASLFLPAAGFCVESDLFYAGDEGYCWSRSLYADDPCSAWHLSFFDFGGGGCDMFDYDRCSGRSVRPVRVVPE